MSLAFLAERQLAISAVRRASSLTDSVFRKLVKSESYTKGDKSPVTVGDYAAQAVIATMIRRAFPDDPIVGEEDSKALRGESGKEMRDRIVQLANDALVKELGVGDNEQWGIGPGKELTPDQLLDAIDFGNHSGGPTGRMWTIDPIDGTKGFLRGEQYAVCVSLIVDAQVQVGVIGCPNLPYDTSSSDGLKGCIFVGVRGQGAEQLNLEGSQPKVITIPSFAEGELNFLESVEAEHSSHSTAGRIASLLGITREPTRMDSQAKYCSLARGDGGVYMRMPTGVGYSEKIWDHAPGLVIVEEAGGVVCDGRGEPLNFGLERTLGENFGVIATGKEWHQRVLKAVQQGVKETSSAQAKA
ncbi:3(2),5-bisphosphate nucleotidase HAL2 [Cylindrobasidium torrendii FP15055 ss-10]|uniref:3'(2'),5'-bisphosphate nucleotidase n=1 Tax=Cylindrobasidium torrendii FP15055 ss-10 TaxID=1314674 RepID=A0A0D7BKX4_9AGAR|nr:3(2),5-bisphosphate nucleotidase HAL2 [Cylindrobasidium torrendii FP15055 ss-10]